jgi:hypothetical protein
MATFKTSDRNDQTDRLLDDTQLDAIVGELSPNFGDGRAGQAAAVLG